MAKRLFFFAALVVILGVSSSPAQQNGPVVYPDVYLVNYFSNAQVGPEQTIHIVNPGQASSVNGAPVDLCAFIYVFDRNQQLLECCGCRLTPNGVVKLGINEDLTDNTLTAPLLTDGAIKIVSHRTNLPLFPFCNPSDIRIPPFSQTVGLAPTLNAWATHLQDSGAVTETEFDHSVLSDGEARRLRSRCKSIMVNASGFGICSCGVN